jgi:two-component system chemotaxis response regulator CheB
MKILIVDDSALVRSILKYVLSTEKDFIVVGEASNGSQAVELNCILEPDIIIMDIRMPVMDGLEASRRILEVKPVPILIFSSVSTITMGHKLMNTGIVDVMRKPAIEQFNEPSFYKQLLQKIRILAEKKIHPKFVGTPSEKISGETVNNFLTKTVSEKKVSSKLEKSGLNRNSLNNKTFKMLVMGASTGGPSAVKTILKELPATFPLCIALVQHMEKGFDQGYANWLNESTSLNVQLAQKSQLIQKGDVIVAPVDRHLIIKKNLLVLYDGPRVLNQKPSVDVLFESAANSFGAELLGVLLTGMGSDGANGCVSIVSKGGFTVVQDKETSAIFGMPKVAIEIGGGRQ